METTAAFTLRNLVDEAFSYEDLPASIDGRLRRFACLGTALLVVANGYLALALWLSAPTGEGQRPSAVLIGWGVLQRAIQLDGHARAVFSVGLVALVGAAILAVATRGFTIGRLWSHLGSLLVGLAGLAATVPPAVALTVIFANALLWFVIAVLAFAVGSALLVGLVSAAVNG
jgi:hypothetical protein